MRKIRRELQGNASVESACGLAAEIVRAFGEVRLRVFGTSMVPAILPADFVSIHRASLQQISPGEVVAFFRQDRIYVHRVVDRKPAATVDSPQESCLITRGDRLRCDDPPVSSSELLGRVVSLERENRKVAIPPGSNYLIVRLLQASDRATYLYVRLAAYWHALFLRRAKCQM